ncbi:hypothetical protein VTJ04DRAFT_2606 [Mycothermus thermophilus]|uniref:uncharacterized protein n=1 Tax=Humicola insolens TaxID=85995 RepID=UPI0037422778
MDDYKTDGEASPDNLERIDSCSWDALAIHPGAQTVTGPTQPRCRRVREIPHHVVTPSRIPIDRSTVAALDADTLAIRTR